MNVSAKILAAQEADRLATAAMQAIEEAVGALVPTLPATCTDEEFEAAEDVRERAEADLGYWQAWDERKAAEDALLATCRAPMVAMDRRVEIVFAVALGERRHPKAASTRSRALALCRTLDARTIRA